jgi:hypothetical protein
MNNHKHIAEHEFKIPEVRLTAETFMHHFEPTKENQKRMIRYAIEMWGIEIDARDLAWFVAMTCQQSPVPERMEDLVREIIKEDSE